VHLLLPESAEMATNYVNAAATLHRLMYALHSPLLLLCPLLLLVRLPLLLLGC